MFHIVFHTRDVEVITAAMDMDEALDGEIVSITDDYSVGPVAGLESPEGLALRQSWWNQILTGREQQDQGAAGAATTDNIKLQQILGLSILVQCARGCRAEAAGTATVARTHELGHDDRAGLNVERADIVGAKNVYRANLHQVQVQVCAARQRIQSCFPEGDARVYAPKREDSRHQHFNVRTGL